MLASKETKNITITFSYKDITDENKLPKSAQSVTVGYEIEYVQSNTKVITTTTQASGSNYGEEIANTSLGNGITATYYGGTPIAKANSGAMAMSNNTLVDDVRYQGGTLVISGTGALPDQGEPYYVNVGLLLFLADATMEEYMSNQSNYVDSSTGNFIFKYNPTNLVVSDGITSIGEFYFNELHTITYVSLPSSLLTIGDYSFRKTGLTSITIPSNVTTIGGHVFVDCTSLTSVNIPGSVTTIGNRAFSHCTSLISVTLNEGLQIIGTRAFEYTNLTGSLRIPNTVTTIEPNAFDDGNNIEIIYLPSSIEYIGGGAFHSMSNNSIIYCETQAVANLLSGDNYDPATTQVIVDPTQFN